MIRRVCIVLQQLVSLESKLITTAWLRLIFDLLTTKSEQIGGKVEQTSVLTAAAWREGGWGCRGEGGGLQGRLGKGAAGSQWLQRGEGQGGQGGKVLEVALIDYKCVSNFGARLTNSQSGW